MHEDSLHEEQLVAEERDRAVEQDVLGLQRPISDLSQLQPIVDISPQTSIAEAVSTMSSKCVGCLLITDNQQLVGLFTERDVLRRVVGQGVDESSTSVSELMTPNPETLPIDSPLVFALQRMSVGGYRHIPLMNSDDMPVAVVSMRDIVEHIVSLYPREILNLPEHPSQWMGRDGG